MNITIFAIFKDKAKFFIRVANGFEGKHDVTFLTTRYHSYRIIKQSGYKVHMLQEFIKDDIDINEFKNYEDEAILMDVKAGFLSEQRARKQFDWLSKGFKNYFKTQNVDRVMLWNGSMLQGFTASLIADSFNIKKLFFEVANFPNKIFIDEKGVNAKSSLMDKDLTICKNYDEKKIVSFLEEHKKKKEKEHIVPQAVSDMKSSKAYYIFDFLYNLVSKYPIYEKEKNLHFFYDYFVKKFINFPYDVINLEDINYIFFPLQVTTDSQVIKNSDLSIEESIDLVVQKSIENNLNLLIKPHPAEKNIKILKKIKSLKKRYKHIYLVNMNTYLLIKNAQQIVTINSTVGLESLMYYKDTVLLGKAFYKKYIVHIDSKVLNKEIIHKFFFNYFFNILVDGNFFDQTEQIYIKV